MMQINNDIDWTNVRWGAVLTYIGVLALFLLSVRLMVGS